MERLQNASSEIRHWTIVVALVSFALFSGCGPAPVEERAGSPAQAPSSEEQTVGAEPAESDTADNELVGQLRFVFVEQLGVLTYLVRGSEAFIIILTQDTAYTDVEPMTAGNGIGMSGRILHSASTYRLLGAASDDVPEEVGLISLATRRFTVEALELVEPGTGPSKLYTGRLVPDGGGSNGFSPILPESVRGRKGLFVEDGTITSTVVMANTGRGEALTNSFVGNDPINTNRQASWATGG